MKTSLIAALLLSLLTACGGGGCNPCGPDVPPPTVDCKAKPEACK